jgi:methionyl-tRNA formyltransferase
VTVVSANDVPVGPDGVTLRAGDLRVTKKAVFVGTGTGPVRLGTVQPHGKTPMAAADWARGTRIEMGERVGDE